MMNQSINQNWNSSFLTIDLHYVTILAIYYHPQPLLSSLLIPPTLKILAINFRSQAIHPSPPPHSSHYNITANQTDPIGARYTHRHSLSLSYATQIGISHAAADI